MFRRGRRLFSAASVGLILVALAHTIGHFSSRPTDAHALNLLATMQSYRNDLGLGMNPSMWDITRSLSLFMTIGLVLMGAQNLLVAKMDESGMIVWRMAVISLIGVGLMTVIFWIYQIPPPLLTLGFVELLFLGAVMNKKNMIGK